MPDQTSKYLLSGADELRRIKFAQFRSQVPSLILLAIAIALPSIFNNPSFFYPELALAMFAIGWYLFIGQSHRFKQRIPLPPEQAMTSPIQGKIAYIRSNDDLTVVNIRKIFLDSVEIRSPHHSCMLEDGVLHLDTEAGRISFRFNFQRIQWFLQPDFTTGNIIGMVVGAGGCTISFPSKPVLAVKASDPVDAGGTLIENIKTGLVDLRTEADMILESLPDYQADTEET